MSLDERFLQILKGGAMPDEPAEPYKAFPIVDWADAYNRPPAEAIVEGLVFPGRWTAFVAPAKTGKSTLVLHIAHRLSRGKSPFHSYQQEPVKVLYLDGEMGEPDTVERLQALELEPPDLTHLHYTDIFPKGDTVEGGTAIVATAQSLGAQIVVFDGLNAFITGAEKDDAPWRALFEHTIAPLKRAGMAIVSSDNTGKDVTLLARGSSAKLDKADAIVVLKRTDDGLNLDFKLTRTHGYHRSLDLVARGLDGNQPINFFETERSWPAGTKELAALLDQLGVPVEAGRDKARTALRAAGHRVRDTVLSAAIKHRKTCSAQVALEPREQFTGTGDEI